MQYSNIENLQETIEGYQLSPQQIYLWKLQANKNCQPYRVQASIIVKDNLNRDILQLAIEKVIERHEILRTNFKNVPGVSLPLQVINSENTLNYQEFNLTELDLPAQQQKCEELYHKFKKITFNFAQDSLLHIYLLILGSQQHIMLISIPSLCGDTTSLENLVNEISSLYYAHLESIEIPEEPLQYVDISAWQQELLTTADAEIGKNYWQQRDIDNGINIKLPGEKHTVEERNYQPNVFSQQLKSSLVEKINHFTDKYTIAPDNLLL
ncbi:MAG: condensation domain-containing protein, partial [Rivularia sp. (in: cyanobacteria)]